MDPPQTRSIGLQRFWHGPLPVIALIGIHIALGLSAVAQKSVTFDEGIHITGGLSYWVKNDYRLQPENGNWSQRFVALPAWLGPTARPAFAGDAWAASNVRAIDDELFYDVGNDADRLLARSRAVMAIPSAALALLVYCWSRRIFGPPGGLVSLTLYCFSPTMLANGFLTTSDLFAALFFSAAVGTQWVMLHRITPATLLLACVCTAGLLLCKSSGVLIAPICLAMLVVRLVARAPLVVSFGARREVTSRAQQLAWFASTAVIQTVGVLTIIWASYGFRYAVNAPGDEPAQLEIPWQEVEAGSPAYVRSVVQIARDYRLLPEAYLYGFSTTLMTSQSRIGYLAGAYSPTGWFRFFPVCLAIKTPVGTFVVLLIGLVGYWSIGRCSTQRVVGEVHTMSIAYRLVPLLALLAVYWGFSLGSSLNIGHRHILPTYPPLFILAGAAGLWFHVPTTATGRSAASRIARALTIVLLTVGAIESLWIWPDYIAYFNFIAGGPSQGYRWLVDSSLDWGQDLKGLARWLDEEHDAVDGKEPVYLSYFGVAHPDYYGLRAELLPSKGLDRDARFPRPLSGGLYCLSATMLECVYLGPRGRWNEPFEDLYQKGRRFVAEIEADRASARDEAPRSVTDLPADVRQALAVYEELRFARLCSYLRGRQPDAQVGHSILIFQLSDDEVADALTGPPRELLAQPET